MRPADWIEEVVPLAGEPICIARPRDFEALLTEEAFECEELLPYWAELWSSGVALAAALSHRRLRGARVLELGCGLALPSLAAARAGGRVTATDWSPPAVSLAARNAAWNGVPIETEVCDWAKPDRVVERAPWKLVLASDVLYDRRNVDLLTALLPRLVDHRGEVWIADPGRPPAETFLERAARSWEMRTVRSARSAKVLIHRLRKGI